MSKAKAPPPDRAALIRLMAEDLSGRGKFFDQAATNTQIVFLEKATSVLTALEAAGCRVVPVEAVSEQVDAAWRSGFGTKQSIPIYEKFVEKSPYVPEPRDA